MKGMYSICLVIKVIKSDQKPHFFVSAIIIATTEDAKKIVFTCARLGPLALL